MGSETSRVGWAVLWGSEELAGAGVDSPRMTAELLLGHVLEWDRTRIVAHPEQPIHGGAQAAYRELIRRRAGGEPLQYTTGHQEFYGRPFRVSPAVLIPRPETELLVEKAIREARACGSTACRVADVGTGSGCIAITVACEIPGATVWGTDISGDALRIARENALRHGALGRILFALGDLLEIFPPRPLFDLILSNPPYVPKRDAHKVAAMVREHEPHVALFGGDSGLEAYERLVPQAAARLRAGGSLILEIGFSQEAEVRGIVEGNGMRVSGILADLQGIPRCIVARRLDG